MEGREGGRGRADERGREAGGWEGREGGHRRAELIKCIDPNESEALSRGGGREGRAGEGRMEGRGRAGQRGRKEILPGVGGGGVELIKCIDPNECEALRRGSTFKPGGLAPPTPLFHRLWGRVGGSEGGREDIDL